MNQACRWSDVTQRYLAEYQEILGYMIRGMTGAEQSGSISRNFIVQMIPHHQAAIEMSQNLLQYTTNVTLQDMAWSIVEEQTKSIADMRRAESCCSRLENSREELCAWQGRMDQVMQLMFYRMERAGATNQINRNFIREMLPHHEGAIAMSENTLRYPVCPELKPILQAIIVSQRQQVRQMQRLLRCVRD